MTNPSIPFGHPDHPFKYESHVMRARGKKSKLVSPWGKFVVHPKREASQLRDPEPPKAA